MAEPAISRDHVVRRSDDVVTAPLGEDLAMMDVDAGTYYVLDDIAHYVWASLAESRRVGDLLVDVLARYDVTPERCDADVLALLDRMHGKGLVRVDR